MALFDPDHIHHEIAHDWFADHRRSGWATCPLTENGFLRTSSRLARTRDHYSVAMLAEALRTFTASGHHELWSDDLTLLDDGLFDPEGVHGHQQLTDIYLLGLAVKRGGALATFDQKIPLAAVKGARRDHVAVLGP